MSQRHSCPAFPTHKTCHWSLSSLTVIDTQTSVTVEEASEQNQKLAETETVLNHAQCRCYLVNVVFSNTRTRKNLEVRRLQACRLKATKVWEGGWNNPTTCIPYIEISNHIIIP